MTTSRRDTWRLNFDEGWKRRGEEPDVLTITDAEDHLHTALTAAKRYTSKDAQKTVEQYGNTSLIVPSNVNIMPNQTMAETSK